MIRLVQVDHRKDSGTIHLREDVLQCWDDMPFSLDGSIRLTHIHTQPNVPVRLWNNYDW